jgi:hypothetical protein
MCHSHTDAGKALLLLHLQAALQNLLPNGVCAPNGSVAHLMVGAQHIEAVWDQGKQGWTIQAAPATPMPPPPTRLSVVYADQPVVRLSGGAGTGTHRLSLLLQAQTPPAALQFLGSDAHSVAPQLPGSATPDAEEPLPVHCTARGCWGGHLPVSVVAVEREEEVEASEGQTPDSLSQRHVLLQVCMLSFV